MKVAIIPARGGSKRIKKKNIKDFFGKPVIAYSIETAINSGCFDKVIVSTDDAEIARIAKQYGAELPFLRPKNIADDFATTADVIKHALLWYQERNIKVDLICCIYACSPFIKETDIRHSLELLSQDLDADYCFPVCEYAFPIQRAIAIDEKSRANMLEPKHLNTRSQDLPLAYHDVGQFYWGRPAAYLNDVSLFSERAIPMPISRKEVIDIDTPEDWEYALQLYKLKHPASAKNEGLI
jgi:N-acylneuraminate cytidylyltransferase